MKKPELIITPGPSGDPRLRGACSCCPEATFVIVGDVEENRRLMREMFDAHFKKVHKHEKASQAAGGS